MRRFRRRRTDAPDVLPSGAGAFRPARRAVPPGGPGAVLADQRRRGARSLFPRSVPESAPVPSQPSAGDSDPRSSSSEGRLLARARGGSRSAVDVLFARYGFWLRRWARGRLPAWARGAVDTSDLVQDTLHHTSARLGGFKSKQTRALRIYLRRAIENRIRDELRQVTRRRDIPVVPSDAAAPQHRQRDGRRPADGWHDDAVPGLVRTVRFALSRCRHSGRRPEGRGAGPARRRRLDAMERRADAGGGRVPREPARCRSARGPALMIHARPVRACALERAPGRLRARVGDERRRNGEVLGHDRRHASGRVGPTGRRTPATCRGRAGVDGGDDHAVRRTVET